MNSKSNSAYAPICFLTTKLFILCVLILIVFVANAEVLSGKVISISDGDSVTFLDSTNKEHKVRLMSIDAPEKSQPFGNEAMHALSNYIFNTEVSVEYKKYDKYKRIVGKVKLDGQDICLQMIVDGLAWHYVEYQIDQSLTDRKLYQEAEATARKLRKGLWQDMNPTYPAVFRMKLIKS